MPNSCLCSAKLEQELTPELTNCNFCDPVNKAYLGNDEALQYKLAPHFYIGSISLATDNKT